VGFARAPWSWNGGSAADDEPFSGAGVADRENCALELVNLWATKDSRPRGVHRHHNNRGGGATADRVWCSARIAGHIIAEVSVDQPRPRQSPRPRFTALVDQIYGLITGRETEIVPVTPDSGTRSPPAPGCLGRGIAGLLELIYAKDGRADLPVIADELNFELDDLLPLSMPPRCWGFLLSTP